MKNGTKSRVMVAPAGVALFALFILCAGARADENKQIVVTVGKMTVVDTPFSVQGFRVADAEVVKVEKDEERKLRVMGVKPGTTDLQVNGGEGLSLIFTITVQENVKAVYAAVMRDLDTVPEVDISINMGRVTIRGEVSSIDHWNYLMRVLKLYQGSVVNLATFKPAPEVMLGFKDALKKTGFVIKEESDKTDLNPGELSLKFGGNNIYVGGTVYSQKDLEKIYEVIRSQSWLITEVKKDAEGENSVKLLANVNVSVIPTMIELDTVFAGVTDEESRQIGVNLAKAGLIALDSTAAAFRGTVGRNNSSGYGGSYTINSGLKGALTFFAGSGPGRINSAGHMVFRNDSPDWKTYQSGGTLKVKTATSDQVGLTDIDYGLIMKVKGGLSDRSTVSLDVELELSYPVPVGTDYDVKKNKIVTSVLCPVGHTLVMGGMKSLLEQTSNEGVPFLRTVPILQWLFSENKKEKQESNILILMSPQIAGAPTASRPVSDLTTSTERESLMPVGERQKEVKGKRRFFSF